MALTRKFLKAMSIEDEKIDQIIEAHTETVSGLKDSLDKAETAVKDLPGVQKELDAAKAELEAVKKDGWKDKHDALKKEFEGMKNEQAKKETHAAKEKAYRALLKETGVSEKRIDAVLKVSDVDGVELDDNGVIKDAAELSKSIKSEWADFIQTTTTKGADTANPPVNTGGKMTREEIYKKDDKGRYVLDTASRQNALAELMASEN